MRNYYQLLMKNPLFMGIPEEKMEPVLQCLKAKKKVFTSRTLLFSSDEPIPCLGLVLNGYAEIFLTDPDGNHTLITQACVGELFGHALAVAHASANIFEIFTSEKAEILFLYVPEFTSLQNCNCTYRFKIMENLMQLIAKNNMELMMKIRILTQGSLRKKLLLYFSILSRQQHSATTTLPFGRDKLANYLFCDRSAVSRELGRMDREGLIQLGKTKIMLTGCLPAQHPVIQTE